MLNNCYMGVIAANDAQPVHQLIKPIPDQLGFFRQNKKKKSEIRFLPVTFWCTCMQIELYVQHKYSLT